eukprot:RCo023366
MPSTGGASAALPLPSTLPVACASAGEGEDGTRASAAMEEGDWLHGTGAGEGEGEGTGLEAMRGSLEPQGTATEEEDEKDENGALPPRSLLRAHKAAPGSRGSGLPSTAAAAAAFLLRCRSRFGVVRDRGVVAAKRVAVAAGGAPAGEGAAGPPKAPLSLPPPVIGEAPSTSARGWGSSSSPAAGGFSTNGTSFSSGANAARTSERTTQTIRWNPGGFSRLAMLRIFASVCALEQSSLWLSRNSFTAISSFTVPWVHLIRSGMWRSCTSFLRESSLGSSRSPFLPSCRPATRTVMSTGINGRPVTSLRLMALKRTRKSDDADEEENRSMTFGGSALSCRGRRGRFPLRAGRVSASPPHGGWSPSAAAGAVPPASPASSSLRNSPSSSERYPSSTIASDSSSSSSSPPSKSSPSSPSSSPCSSSSHSSSEKRS